MKNDIFQKNEIYNRQLAMLIMCTALVSNVTRLPRLIVQNVADMVFLVELIFCIAEILIFMVVYFYISMDGLQLCKDNCTKPLKFLFSLLLIPLTIKFFTTYSSVTIYIVSTMFRSIPSYVIILSLILPIVYLAYKGIVSIARTSEVLFWFIILLIIFSLIFYDAEMDITRLLPIVKDDFSVLAKGTLNLGVWAGDLLPFLLLKLKKRKFPYLAVALPLNYILVMIYVTLAVATFGGAIFIVENIFVYIPIFNSFSSTLGELQWLGLIDWILMVLLYMVCLLWAIFEIGELLVKKRSVFAGVFTVAFIIAILSIKSLEKVIYLATTPYAGAICWIGFTILPLALLLLAIYAKRKCASPHPKNDATSENQNPVSQGSSPKPATEKNAVSAEPKTGAAAPQNSAVPTTPTPDTKQNSMAISTPPSPDLKQFVILDAPQKGENL